MRLKYPVGFILCAFVGLATLTLVGAQAGPNEQAIRRLRAASNAAIARHDTAGIGAVMADNVIVVTSRSAQQIGRAANMTSFAEQFRTRPDVVYERTPDQVRLYEPWGMASEYGRWAGSWTDTDGKIQIGGVYFAKWRLKNGSWLVESETYFPVRCTGGSYCRTAP
jgi:ketosteroid isomerase-like protein